MVTMGRRETGWMLATHHTNFEKDPLICPRSRQTQQHYPHRGYHWTMTLQMGFHD
jgi:hypothetical protein